ncbi:C40 family peptidase [Chitinophaga sp. XS-30]|uniref:C40 family peptidase n=1 Tax=Chitinophaga sp. XS-30 TaxID=2604421 RepID=UPI0011DCF924|nr:NlpC/P60 family protein [Chitinophaga sp. XS-30]QEH42094.1 glycoside hydrolase [Chitinophaga sp. XS-30]
MMRRTGKTFFILTVCAVFLASCAVTKKQQQTASKPAKPQEEKMEFIDGIAISPDAKSSVHQYKGRNTQTKNNSTANSLEAAESWQFKYAQLLDVPVENVGNARLFTFIEDWWGAPYRLGGNSKTGIDCSNFVNTLLGAVFQMSIAGNSIQLYNKVKRLRNRNELQLGDLVFFAINRSKRISHVGIYLENDRFVHASSSSGVVISDLKEPYWKRYYAGAGRL